MNPPSFAVVGRPNKGKSSIVATLARDDSVYIDSRAGSTRKTERFPMMVGDEVLYVLYDTPGMQRSREVLAWLQEHGGNASSRPHTVRRFLEAHRGEPRYEEACEMLDPVVGGAGIIYVVDASCPFGADYEPEMEILRWASTPSLALINNIHNDDYIQEWRDGLSQYFHTVRVFDAHHAEFAKQLELLELFGHLDPDWRLSIDRAIAALQAERDQQHRAAGLQIADFIVEAMSYSISQPLVEGVPEEPVKKLVAQRYTSYLVKQEKTCRKRVEELFHYRHLQRSEAAIPLQDGDLFNLDRWYLWGLSRKSLLRVATASGALVGGGAGTAVDAATGGLLGGLGTLISGAGGAALGRYGAVKYADEIGQLKIRGIPTGGSRICFGPSRNPNFPFVLLGRALEHHRLLARRTHAHRETLELNNPLLDVVSEDDRRKLGRIFADIRREKELPRRQAELAELIYQYALRADL
jgi:hypothetical protein